MADGLITFTPALPPPRRSHHRVSDFQRVQFHSKNPFAEEREKATVVDVNMQPNTRPVAPLPKRPSPFDAVVGYEEKPPGPAYPRGPRKALHLGSIEWNWSFMHDRVSPYYLHRARRHWVLWTKVPDEWERLQWMPLGYVPHAQATCEEAAVHLVADCLRFERDEAKLDRFEAVTCAGQLSRSDWDRIARSIWPPEIFPSIKDTFPFTTWLPVPPGEEPRVVDVVAALHDSAFLWEEVDPSDERSYVRSLRGINENTAAAIRGDSDAMNLMAFLARTLRSHRAGFRSQSGVELPKAKYTIAPHGGMTFHSPDGRRGAIALASELSLALPWFYERMWTPEAEERLRAYLARPGYIIPRGTGTREAASSIAAIYMALTGKLSNRPPECMSYVIGRWMVLIQDEVSQEVRNDATWRNLLPLAARTGREREFERLNVLVEWVWDTVLPSLAPVAEKYSIGTNWRRFLSGRTVRSATASIYAVEGALASLGEDFLPAQHDDDLWILHEAANAARETAVASSGTEFAGTRDAKGCVNAALKATRAAANTGVSWQTLDPVFVLQKMIGA